MSGYSRHDVIWFPGFHIKPERTYTQREVSAIVDARILASRRELNVRLNELESGLRLFQTLQQTTQLERGYAQSQRNLYIGDDEDE